MTVIYTIGHSTRSLETFVALLRAHDVRQVADIRTVPRSRRYPHFSREALAPALGSHDVGYRHFPGLGGLRRPRIDSVNVAWRNEGFRGYADYMQTPAFDLALRELLEFSAHSPTAIMCAEAVWWRCHRQLVADALVARDMEVRHVMSAAPASLHQLNASARVVNGRLTYPDPGVQPGRDAARLKK